MYGSGYLVNDRVRGSRGFIVSDGVGVRLGVQGSRS
jgi:hypothetical protein